MGAKRVQIFRKFSGNSRKITKKFLIVFFTDFTSRILDFSLIFLMNFSINVEILRIEIE